MDPTLLFISPFSSVSNAHKEWLSEENGTQFVDELLRQDQKTAFEIYEVGSNLQQLAERLLLTEKQTIYIAPMVDRFPEGKVNVWGEAIEYPINFGNVVELIGVEAPYDVVFNARGIPIQLYFQPLVSQSPLPLNVFVHVITTEQFIVAQRDLLGILPSSWSEEMMFVQDNFVPFNTPVWPALYTVVLGVYNWQTNERLPILDANGEVIGDRIVLNSVYPSDDPTRSDLPPES